MKTRTPTDTTNPSNEAPTTVEPVPFSERARLVRRAARAQVQSGIMRARQAANEKLEELARAHDDEIEVNKRRVRSGVRRAYAMTSMSAVFSAFMVAATVTTIKPRMIDDALVGISQVLPAPALELPSLPAPLAGEAISETQDPAKAQAKPPAPARSTWTRTAPKKAAPSTLTETGFACTADEYDPLNPCLL
jgi:hypothetical protein